MAGNPQFIFLLLGNLIMVSFYFLVDMYQDIHMIGRGFSLGCGGS